MWMGKMRILFIILLVQIVSIGSVYAFKNGTMSLGIGYYSQNSLNRISNSDSGSTGLLGKTFTPLNFKYDHSFSSEWFVSSGLSYTLLQRSMVGSTGQVSFTHLTALFGKNMSNSGGSVWDWYAGPGLIRYTIKGSGGTTVMNNGTGTATFAVPGGTSIVQKLTTNLGTSVTINKSVISFDMIVENFFSSKKRVESLMLGYAYQLGDF